VMVLTGEGMAWSAGKDIKEYFGDVKEQPRIGNIRRSPENAARSTGCSDHHPACLAPIIEESSDAPRGGRGGHIDRQGAGLWEPECPRIRGLT
jgi:hypothetical protein